MSRRGAVTLKGEPLTLVGEGIRIGQMAPSFELTFYEGGMQTVTLEDLKGRPSVINVVTSLDTPVCQQQTKSISEEMAELGESVNVLTVSADLPFAQKRFCESEDITNMRVASDYQDRSFGKNWGMLIEELKFLARGLFILDREGIVIYADTPHEVTDEPDYGPLREFKNIASRIESCRWCRIGRHWVDSLPCSIHGV